jgi:ribose transport system substrate-binding protein
MTHRPLGRGAQRNLALVATAAVVAASISACSSSGSGTQTGTGSTSGVSQSNGENKLSTIYFTNNFADNDWRQQMQKTVELAAQLPQYKSIVKLKVSNSGVSPQEQSATIDNIIQAGDAKAIIMEAASPEAVNPAIQRACTAGIKVVTFDSTATAPCAWRVSVDWKYNGQVTAAWVAQILGGKGKVAVDYGLKGLAIGQDFVAGVKEQLAKTPGMNLIAQYEGGFNPGQERAGTAAALASNPDLAASMTMYVGSSAGTAFKAAGSKNYIYVGTANNQGATECVKDPSTQCIFWDDSPGISVLALQTALDAISGKAAKPSTIIMNAPDGSFFAKGPLKVDAYPNAPIQAWKDGTNFYSTLSPALALPVLPKGVDLPIAAKDVTK